MPSLKDVLREMGAKSGNRKRGGEEVYYCPRHDDETPDLWVNESKGCFHCFGGGSFEGGQHPVTLVMHIRDCTKQEAIEWMAENFEEYSSEKPEDFDKKEEAKEVLNTFKELTNKELLKNDGELRRIKDTRELTEKTIEDMGIGWVNDNVIDSLKDEFSEEALKNSGLFSGDYFIFKNHREVIPYEKWGDVVYYIGRKTVDSGDEPKYKKLESTDYNYHALWQKIDERDKLIITEGIYDAISAYHGSYSVVSPVTKQFNERDVHKVLRIAEGFDEVYIALDDDEAGRKGTEKTADELYKRGFERNINIVEFPENIKDFDELTMKYGYDKVKELLLGSKKYMEKLTDEMDSEDDLDDIVEKIVPKGERERKRVKQMIKQKSEANIGTKYNYKEVDALIESLIESEEALDEKYDLSSVEDMDLFKREIRNRVGEAIPSIVGDYLMEKYIFLTTRDSNENMYVYENGVYKEKGEPTIKAELKELLGGEYTDHRKNETISYIEASTYFDKSNFSPEWRYINMENGIYDIEEDNFFDHDPEYRFLNKLPVEYDPDVDCEEIKEFFKEMVDEDQIQLLQEIFGFSMMRKYLFKKAMLFYGPTDTGKSVTLDILEMFLGKENCTNWSLNTLTERRFAKAQLYGSLANVSGDLSSDKISQTGVFKQLTGKDTLTAENKGQDPFNFENCATLVFSSNPPIPMLDEDSDAIFNRFVLLKFDNQIPKGEQEPNLAEKLCTDEALSGLFNWALKGLKRLIEEKQFSNTKSIEETRELYERLSDPVKAFCEDILKTTGSENDYIPLDDLHNAWQDYTEENELSSLSKRRFSTKMNEVSSSIEKKRPHIKGKQTNCKKGVEWANDDLREKYDIRERSEDEEEGSQGDLTDIESSGDDRTDKDKILDEIPEEGIQTVDLIDKVDISESKIDEIVSNMLTKGTLFEPKPGFIKKT